MHNLSRTILNSRSTIYCRCSNFTVKTNVYNVTSNRFLATNEVKSSKTLKKEKEKLRTYIIQRYVQYVKKYTKIIETRFPTAMNMYRVFSIGIKDFMKDLKSYISLRLKVGRDRGFSKMSSKEIELYRKMPSDMLRVAPVLILAAIPFGNYLIFPIAFLWPKSMLCSHFWSIQQRAEFSVQDLKDRLKNNRPVFRYLQSKVDVLPDNEITKQWKTIIALLGSGNHPTPEDIIACKELFVSPPYSLSSLKYAHMGLLLKMHGLKKGVFRSNKLKYRAFILLEIDKAIIREGGVNQLSTESLRAACLIRGLNSTHLTNQEMRQWLDNWLFVSKQVDKNSYSLILHCPIFFAYNRPENWVLIY